MLSYGFFGSGRLHHVYTGTLDRRIHGYAHFEIAPQRPTPLDAMIAEVERPLKGGAGRARESIRYKS